MNAKLYANYLLTMVGINDPLANLMWLVLVVGHLIPWCLTVHCPHWFSVFVFFSFFLSWTFKLYRTTSWILGFTASVGSVYRILILICKCWYSDQNPTGDQWPGHFFFLRSLYVHMVRWRYSNLCINLYALKL